MKVYEFGTEHEKNFAMFQCAAEPWWFFEASAKEKDLAYTQRIYPQTVLKEFDGLAHAELVLMFPERFFAEVKRFMNEEMTQKECRK